MGWINNFFGKILNIRSGEALRVWISWTLNFLYRMMFIFAWTSAVVMFVSHYGIARLPFLFIVNAIFIICGTFLYSVLVSRFSDFYVMVFTGLGLAIAYFLSFYFFSVHFLVFFFSLMLAVSVLSQQFKIVLIGYVEDMFTSLQGERLFPIIESADTFGGVTAGLLSIFLSRYFGVNVFLLICVVISVLLVLFLLFASKFVHFKNMEKEHTIDGRQDIISFLKTFKSAFKNRVYYKYITYIFFSIFLYWGMFSVLEFLYTNAIYDNISFVVRDAGSGFEHALIHDLGGLFVLYSLSSFFVQLFVGSRLIKALGVFGSMLLHPIIMIFNVLGLVFNYGFASAVLAKNNATITSVIFTNSYHVSFYVVSEKYRLYVRELSDGVVRPLGALFGTFIILFLQYFYYGNVFHLVLNFSLIVLTVALFFILYVQRKNYTDLAIVELGDDRDLESRINAVDVLAQRGHLGRYPVLQRILMDEQSPISLRVKVLDAFSELGSFDVIYDVISCLSDKRRVIRNASLNALLEYDFGHKKFNRHMIEECRLVSVLKLRFKDEQDKNLREKILKLMMQVDAFSTFQYLVSLMSHEYDENVLAEVIYSLSLYSDTSVLSLIERYLNSSDDDVRRSALVCKSRLDSLFASNFILDAFSSFDVSLISDALYLIGDLKLRAFKKKCREFLHSGNDEHRLLAAIAFGRMNDYAGVYVISNFLVFGKNGLDKKTYGLVDKIAVRILNKIDKMVSEMVDNELRLLGINHADVEFNNFSTFSKVELERIQFLIELRGHYDFLEKMNIYINNN